MAAARGLARVSCALLAAILAAGCSAGRATPYRPTEDGCYDLAVRALHRHVALAAGPPACAGLSPAQVDIAVARAIREVTGARPKAIARHLAYQDRAYLARLVSTSPPAPPSEAVPPVVPQAAAPARASPDLVLDLGALASWVLTAGAGAYLLAGWLVRWLAGRRRRPRRRRVTDAATAFTFSHFGLALAGLGTWIAFVATGLPVLAWVALGLVVPIAGLGMGVLAARLPEPARTSVAARRAQSPVIVIAAHGMLATLTILLVLLAAIGAA